MFGISATGAQNSHVRRKQIESFGVDGVSDICKHYSEWIMTICQTKVSRGHNITNVKVPTKFGHLGDLIHVLSQIIIFSRRVRTMTLNHFMKHEYW